MKYRFLPLLFCIVLISFFSACGSNENKTSSDTKNSDTTSAATQTTPAAPASTIVTTPTNMMVVRHKVTNFDKWKVSYDDHDSMRVANGIHSYVIGRGLQDSNEVLVAVKIDDLA